MHPPRSIRTLAWTGTAVIVLIGAPAPVRGASSLPTGPEPEPVPVAHFPSPLHAFVWRNWGLVPTARLETVLGASSDQIESLAASMGLPSDPPPTPDMERRGYLTLIRRNWHLLPYEQLLRLLDWTEDELAYTLREDDFFWIKLGQLKPRCAALVYRAPTPAESARAAAIRDRVVGTFGEDWLRDREPRFDFVRQLSSVPPRRPDAPPPGSTLAPRFLYSYFALYGDPLLEPELDPFPDGYLARLAEVGVDGIWLQGVLRRLAPSPLFPEEGKDSARRLESLRNLVDRAARHGIGVFLYFNEPRAQMQPFFEGRPELQGVREGDFWALCTSAPEVQAFLRDGARHIFREVPRLRGLFTITASENLTSCWSHHRGAECPRCSKREPAEVIAEVHRLLAEGARESSPSAQAIAWDWGWADAWAEPIVKALPPWVRLQSVSEWSLPIERGGVRTEVGEYSISAVGPGPRALRHWGFAKARGLPFGAKVQIGVTWELSSVPYVPALELIAEHMDRLRATGVTSLMLGWTLGGYPSPNLELASAWYGQAPPSPRAALEALARRRYGAAARDAMRAWKIFSEAYREYPYHPGVLYAGPQQMGPANLLHAVRTGYASTMVGFPYDHLDGWRAVYPPDVFASQFEKVATRWKEGEAILESAAAGADEPLRAEALRDLDVARACRIHFASVAAQARFVLARDALAKTAADDADARRALTAVARRQASIQMDLARELFEIARRDSRIGYEASNHYYYLPRDLVESWLCCRHILDEALPRGD